MNTEGSSKAAKSKKVVNPESVGFSSIEELHDALHKNWNWIDYIQVWWYKYFWNWFSAIPSEIKYFIQRGIRGYSDRDSWSLDMYLSDIILCNLVELLAKGHCVPSTPDENGEWGYSEERWKQILRDMIDGFALVKKACIGDEIQFMYGSREEKNSFTKFMRKRGCSCRALTEEEETTIEKAFDLFKTYFWCLND